MNFLLEHIKKTKAFYLGYIIFLVLGGFVMLTNSKPKIHLFINQHHSPVADTFFKYITNLGDGWSVVVLVVILIFINYRYAIVMAVCNILGGIVSQILKHYVFPGMLRPKGFFNNIAQLYFVPGVEIFSYNSFPSGHSVTAFAIFCCLAAWTKNSVLQIIYICSAIVIGFSRVYLSQHFFEDVYCGSIIGVLCGMSMLLVFQKLLQSSSKK